MTSYARPGVYIQEKLSPLAPATADNTGRAYAAFVGTSAVGGPVGPTLVSSWQEYVNRYGGFSGTELLPHAVYQYFNNGGTACYVVRAVASDAAAAKVTLKKSAVDKLDVTAISGGTWGNGIKISTTARLGGAFDFVVSQGNLVKERFTDVTLNPADGRFIENLVNSPISGSALVTVKSRLSAAWTTADVPDDTTATPLASGSDGVAAPDLGAAAKTLADTEAVINLNLPGVSDSAVLNPLITWAASRNNVFLVIDGPRGSQDTSASTTSALTGLLSGGSALSTSSYAAVYAPYITVSDPASPVRGATRQLPPGGAVLGQFVRSDQARGTAKAPAGLSARLNGVVDVVAKFSDTDLETLNTAGINAIKAVPGVGFCIWGARTLAQGQPDRYISIRRALMEIETTLTLNTRFALFEPNDAILWRTISANVTQYLQNLFQAGVLRGDTPQEAYFVQCDAGNNPPASANSGIVNVTVGVALSAPAEFIVFNIQQNSGSSAGNA